MKALAERAEPPEHGSQVFFHRPLGNFRCHYQNGRVIGITTSHAFFLTPEGFGVWDKIHEVIDRHGEPDKIYRNAELAVYLYYDLGYLFTVKQNDEIASITVASDVESFPALFEAWNIVSRIGIEHIAPGEEPLRVNIGDTFEQVNALAEPRNWVNDNNQVLFHHRLGKFQCLYENGKVNQIIVLDKRFKTAAGIGVGSSPREVVNEYGEPDEIREREQFTLHLYIKFNGFFGFLPNDKNVSFVLFE